MSSRCITNIAFRIAIKASFGHLQDVLARCFARLNKISLRHLTDVFLLTDPSQQTTTCLKLATKTQKQGVKTL